MTLPFHCIFICLSVYLSINLSVFLSIYLKLCNRQVFLFFINFETNITVFLAHSSMAHILCLVILILAVVKILKIPVCSTQFIQFCFKKLSDNLQLHGLCCKRFAWLCKSWTNLQDFPMLYPPIFKTCNFLEFGKFAKVGLTLVRFFHNVINLQNYVIRNSLNLLSHPTSYLLFIFQFLA